MDHFLDPLDQTDQLLPGRRDPAGCGRGSSEFLRPLQETACLPLPLLLPKGGRTRDLLDRFLQPAREKLTISMELESSEMLKRFVLAGLGVSFLARSFAQAELRAGTLKLVPLRGGLAVQLGLIYKDKPLSRAALAFIEVATSSSAPSAPRR